MRHGLGHRKKFNVSRLFAAKLNVSRLFAAKLNVGRIFMSVGSFARNVARRLTR